MPLWIEKEGSNNGQSVSTVRQEQFKKPCVQREFV